jgi:hypothetical protein
MVKGQPKTDLPTALCDSTAPACAATPAGACLWLHGRQAAGRPPCAAPTRRVAAGRRAEEVIPLAALKESVNREAYRYAEAHIGPREKVGNKGGSLPACAAVRQAGQARSLPALRACPPPWPEPGLPYLIPKGPGASPHRAFLSRDDDLFLTETIRK